MAEHSSDRFSDTHQNAHQKALHFHQQVLAIAHAKTQGHEQANFFPVLFKIAADQIETDVNEFCDRADMVFEEIEAFGQEPDLDTGWLDELTGEKDTFYFSTDSLVSEMPPLPGMKKGRKPQPPDENEVIQAVNDAVEMAEAQDVLAISHLENPADWIHRIAQALRDNQGSATFRRLRQTTGLSTGALFLGLLLGHDSWTLQQECFYGEVTVGLRN